METNPSPTEPPAPWLGTAAGDGAALQSWSLGVRPGALLVARFDFEPTEFRRCWFFIFHRRLLFFVAYMVAFSLTTSLAGAVLVFSGAVLIANRHPPFWEMLAGGTTKLLSINLPIALFTAALSFVAILLLSVLKPLLPRKPPTVFVADADGVGYETVNKPASVGHQPLAWKKIGRIVERGGDVFVLPRLIGVTLYVPRSAFADAGAAARFAAVATALWKANGGASAIDPAALAEFQG